MVDFVLDDLRRVSAKGLDSGLKLRSLPLHFYGLISSALSRIAKGAFGIHEDPKETALSYLDEEPLDVVECFEERFMQ